MVFLNIGITGRCNARCYTCPRDALVKKGDMPGRVFESLLEKIDSGSKYVHEANFSGHGEPTIHPDFLEYMCKLKEFNDHMRDSNKRQIKFGVITNGERLDLEKLEVMNRVLYKVGISFGSVVRESYERIHLGLDYDRVKENIYLARKILKKPILQLHITPTNDSLRDIEETARFSHNLGIDRVVFFGLTSNRAGNLDYDSGHVEADYNRNVVVARALGLTNLEQVFYPGILGLAKIFFSKRHCLFNLPTLYIDPEGDYHFCLNDFSDKKLIGNVNNIGIRKAVKLKDSIDYVDELCDKCNSNQIDKNAVKMVFSSLFRSKKYWKKRYRKMMKRDR